MARPTVASGHCNLSASTFAAGPTQVQNLTDRPTGIPRLHTVQIINIKPSHDWYPPHPGRERGRRKAAGRERH